MSFAHLGYPVVSAPSMGPQATVTSRSSPKSPPGSPCCETGRPIMTDPMTGQTVCSCQYGPAGAALYNYRVPGLPEALFNSAAMAAQLQQFAGADPSALYGGMASPYEFKGLPTAAGLYPYDPALAAYPYAAGFLDPNARRKNATRESTQTLKAWLTEHKKNPYPTKGEKIMLAIITKMTLTQVSTWFANARRRLKKENKMTWEPRNRMDEDDDDINSDIDENEKKDGEDENISVDSDDDDDISQLHHNPLTASLALHHAQQLSSGAPLGLRPNFINAVTPHQMLLASSHQHPLQQQNSLVNTDSRTPDSNKSVPSPVKDNETKQESSTNATSPSERLNSSSKDSQRPKIWSMAEIATSSSKTNSESSVNSQSPHHHNKIPSIISQGLHPAWRGAHPYLHPHLAHRMAAFPIGQHPPQHIAAAGGQRPPILPAFASLPQLRHTDSANHVSAFSPPASATSPSTQAQRNV